MTVFDSAKHPRGNARTGHAGQFAAKTHEDNDGVTLGGADTAVRTKQLSEVNAGEWLWDRGIPRQVTAMHSGLFDRVEVAFASGPPAELTATDRVHASPNAPLGDFGEPQDFSHLDFDDPSETFALVDHQVEYNSEGYGRVLVAVQGDRYVWHANHAFLGDNPEETLPDGRAKFDAIEQWAARGEVMSFIDEAISERYPQAEPCGTGDQSPDPSFVTYATEPGELSDEQVAHMAHVATMSYRNEADPGSFGAEYPYRTWMHQAAAQHGGPWEGWDD